MGRPPKPVSVIKSECKSHRTKAELAARANAEKSMLSGQKLCERAEVKSNKIAHAEFKRVSKLMKAIDKDDALYSSGLNTYCQLYAEISELECEKTMLNEIVDTLSKKADKLENLEFDELLALEKSLTRLISQKLNICAAIDKKRKMMLEIDKENVMTISAALRSIPKSAPEKAENPLIKVLLED